MQRGQLRQPRRFYVDDLRIALSRPPSMFARFAFSPCDPFTMA